jgi:FKBP-type peptidyl-prolyl cis-trans isomerase SlyD
MQITKDVVVSFSYDLKDEEGLVLESTDEGQPMAYLHGHNNMMTALEKAFEGKQAGDQFSATLSPKEGYGERNEDAIQRIPVKHLQPVSPNFKRWVPGMIAVVETDQGRRQVRVVKVGKFMVTVDANHPLAGKTITFDVTVKEVREASAEELSHGHAHGVGGHQH